MNKFWGVLLVGSVFLISGCASAKKVTVQAYIEDHPREDLDLNEGNKGYLVGTPSLDELGNKKTTRKMFVVEVTKPATEVDTKILNYDETKQVSEVQSPEVSEPAVTKTEEEPQLNIPNFDGVESSSAKEETSQEAVIPDNGQFEEYTIQKGDTLQKISEKFYNTSKRWYKIYEANKDRIKDPDRLMPGKVIRIPNLK